MLATTLPETQPYFDLNPGTSAHCRRVAAWCEQIAVSLGLSKCERATLQQAALTHHHPGIYFRDSGFSKLIEDLGIKPELTSSDPAPEVNEVLRKFHQRQFSRHLIDLPQILEAANLYDEELEFAPFETNPLSCTEPATFCLKHLRRSSTAKLPMTFARLPVYPAVAMQIHRMLSQDDLSLQVLEGLAKSDQVIAGKLVSAANSAFYSPLQRIKSISQAISYVGTDDARRLLLASAIQPLFSSVKMRKLWNHAVESAQIAEALALLTTGVDPAEAFLVGLLHDIGKLALSLMPETLDQSIDRLVCAGCAPALAELTVCGFDHAYAGAEVLRHWNFSEDVISAVRHHHQPERFDSKLASILYLTEFRTDSEEDLPSEARFARALQATGLSQQAVKLAGQRLSGALAAL